MKSNIDKYSDNIDLTFKDNLCIWLVAIASVIAFGNIWTLLFG